MDPMNPPLCLKCTTLFRWDVGQLLQDKLDKPADPGSFGFLPGPIDGKKKAFRSLYFPANGCYSVELDQRPLEELQLSQGTCAFCKLVLFSLSRAGRHKKLLSRPIKLQMKVDISKKLLRYLPSEDFYFVMARKYVLPI